VAVQLNDYLKQTQRFLREQRMDLLNPEDLIEYINAGRREVAARAQCVRVLTPISAPVVSATVTSGGNNNYSAATLVTISPPDFPSGKPPSPNGAQAIAQPIISNGQIMSVSINQGGDGYFQPIATVTDPTGAGQNATVTLTTAPVNVLNPMQEQYQFSDINVAMFPGVSSVYAILDVSVIYANYRYSLPIYSFPTYQAMIRQYPFQYAYVPTFCSQYGQGASGSFFAYPWPSQTYQWEFDCLALPADLLNNNSAEVIPQPWDDIVPYWAAHLGFLELQNFNAAEYFFKKFDDMIQRRSGYARPGRLSNPYGRW
jgi:hypothetical protein